MPVVRVPKGQPEGGEWAAVPGRDLTPPPRPQPATAPAAAAEQPKSGVQLNAAQQKYLARLEADRIRKVATDTESALDLCDEYLDDVGLRHHGSMERLVESTDEMRGACAAYAEGRISTESMMNRLEDYQEMVVDTLEGSNHGNVARLMSRLDSTLTELGYS